MTRAGVYARKSTDEPRKDDDYSAVLRELGLAAVESRLREVLARIDGGSKPSASRRPR